MLCVPENHPNDQFPSDISNKQRLASLFLLLDSFFFFSTPDVPLKSRWLKNLGVDTPQLVYTIRKDPSEWVAHLSSGTLRADGRCQNPIIVQDSRDWVWALMF